MKRLLAAIVLLAGALAAWHWWKPKPDASGAAATSPGSTKPLVTFNIADVQRVEVDQPGQPAIVLTRSGSDWKMTQPVAYDADAPTVNGLVSSLSSITGATAMDAGANPAAFGLDKPATVILGMGSKQMQFDFGADNPTGGSTYMRVGPNGTIQMAPNYVKEAAIKPPFAFQDKTILKFSPDKITGMEVEVNGKKAEFARKDGNWPKDQDQDITSLIDAVQNGQITSLADPIGKDLAKDGLDHPSATLSVAWSDGRAELDIGAKKGAAEYYAKNNSGPAIFTVSDYLFTDINNLVNPSKPAATPK